MKNDIIRDLRSSMTIPSNRNGSMDSEDDGDLTASTSFVPVDLDRAQANLLLDRAINLSWVVNFLLLLAKIYVGVVSNSKSMWASLADSFVDLLSQVVLSLAAKYSRKHNPEYPVGRSRLEALSVLACAFIMIIASIQVVQYSISDLVSGFNGNIPVLDLETIMIVIIILGIVAKLVLHIYCRFANNASNSDALAALAEDHLNDVMSNSVALATASIAVRSTGGWWVDPVGAIVISIAIIYRWIFVMSEQVRKVVGYTAPPDFIVMVNGIAATHDPRLLVDCTRAYYFGARYNVEMEVVLPGSMTVIESHDIALALQHKIESLEEVERAFVHVDYLTRDGLEHKIERELVKLAEEKSKSTKEGNPDSPANGDGDDVEMTGGQGSSLGRLVFGLRARSKATTTEQNSTQSSGQAGLPPFLKPVSSASSMTNTIST